MPHRAFHCFNNNNYKRKEPSEEHTQVSDQDWVSADDKKISDRDIGSFNRCCDLWDAPHAAGWSRSRMVTLVLAPRRTGDGSQRVSLDPGSLGTTNKREEAEEG